LGSHFLDAGRPVNGAKQKAHFFVVDLLQSDAYFLRTYPAATVEA
jgi:hypothetical protein